MESMQPKLRFPEFKGNWEKKLFSKTCEINPSNKELPNKFIYIDLESVNNGILSKENEILLEDAPSRAQRLLFKKDVLFQMVRPYQKNNFYFNKEGVYVASTGYAQLRAFDSSEFLFQYLHNQKFVDNVIEKCTGSNYPAINSKDLSSINVVFPKKEEQTKIANFLSAVDEKLNLLKEKKSLLEDYKKGIMQKIFNQEIRFKDDNGNDFVDWKLKRLKDFMVERNIQLPKNDKYPLMSFVAKKGVTEKGPRYDREFLVNDEENKKYKQTEFGDFIYSSNNLETGSIGLNNYGSASISPVYSIFKINELCDYRFISNYFSRKEFISKMTKFRQGVMYGQWRIHEKDFLQIEENFPCLMEQTKIANFLSAIDEKIELVSNQIEDTQEYKKGLLQQMFI
jgi:type I restriction enzyme S subunit